MYGEIVRKKAKSAEQEGGFAHLKKGRQESVSAEASTKEQRDSLFERLRAGNHAAAFELVDAYYEQIYLFMRRLGHGCQVSEDLTQESFMQAWRHIGQLRSGKALNSWLYRIAGNVSKLYWRRGKGREATGFEGMDVPDGGEGVSEITDRMENLGRLKGIVEDLPAKLRQVVVLHYMQQLTIREGAEAAGVTKGTFKSRLNRALKAIRKQIIAEDGELL